MLGSITDFRTQRSVKQINLTLSLLLNKLFCKRYNFFVTNKCLLGIAKAFMSLQLEEVNETQQLMQNEEEDEQKISQSATSPVASNKLSSGAASLTSKNQGQTTSGAGNNSINESTKISYVSERRLHRDLMRSNNKPKNIPKGTPDVKNMEKALLELLDDFHTGKLSAFGTGCSMDQMINIRDQQEHLARLHFRLCADVEKPDKSDDNFENSASRDKMAQLVQSLAQLSASIEHLHSDVNSTNVNSQTQATTSDTQ